RRFTQSRDVELFKQSVEVALAPLGVRLDHFEHGADVLLDAQPAENGGFLRQVADAQAGALVHRQRRHVVAVEFDASFIGLDESRDHVEDRRLAGAVGAEEADSLALAHVKTDTLDDLTPNEALLHAVDGKHVLAAGRRGAVAAGPAARPDRRLGNVFRQRFGLRSVFWLRSALRLRRTL